MLLQEEYLLRHNLNDVPLINYVDKGAVLLKQSSRYVLFTIDWIAHDRRPGKFYLNYHIPLHNGCNEGRFFQRVVDYEVQLEWEDYVNYFSNWQNRWQYHDAEIVMNDVVLAFWEVFAYCCNDWLEANFKLFIKKLLYKSLDLKADLVERYAAYQEILVYLSNVHTIVFKDFERHLLSHVQNYCYWLN